MALSSIATAPEDCSSSQAEIPKPCLGPQLKALSTSRSTVPLTSGSASSAMWLYPVEYTGKIVWDWFRGKHLREPLHPLVRPIADAAVVALVLGASAGTPSWWRAWLLVAVLLVVRTATVIAVYRASPALMRERATLTHDDQPWIDKIILFAGLAAGYVALPMIAARDVFYWHLLPRPAPAIADAGLVLFVLGWTLKGIALRQNAFAITVVRVQREQRHAVVDDGMYRFVRHPFYAGTPLVLVGMALWLESFAAAIYAAVPIAIMLMRIAVEERLLRRELAGYKEYAMRVRYRLVPGIW